MKTPLRFQVTEYDCGTVSLYNAISYLFDREEIPAKLLKTIHKYTLDCYDENGNPGQGGTSKEAIEKITACVKQKGCVLIRCWLETGHYVIITNIIKDKKNKLYLYLLNQYE